MKNSDELLINLSFGCAPFELAVALLCSGFGVIFLVQGVESAALFSSAISAPLFVLAAVFLKQLLLGPRTTRINLQSGEVVFLKGWPLLGSHSAISLLDYRRVYIRATRPVGTYLLNVIDHLGKEHTLAKSLSLERAKQVSEQISKRLGLANDSLIT